MVLANTSDLKKNKSPKSAVSSICIPRQNPNLLLPLQEVFQVQQVGLTQAPFKLLPLQRDPESVRAGVCPLRAESVSYCPPGLPYASPESLQSRMPWGPLVQDPQAGQPDVGPRPLRPWETLCSGDYSVLVYLPMEVRLNSITSPALLFVLLWFFLYIFRCGQSLLLIFRLFS